MRTRSYLGVQSTSPHKGWWQIWLCQWFLAWLRFGAILCASMETANSAPPVARLAPAADFANPTLFQPQFDAVGDTESIPDGIVTALVQDARGLIWIGTQNGLIRYDGYTFHKFLHVASDPSSLAGNFVLSLWAAQDGRIWVGTNSDGVSVFNPESERFEHFRHDGKQANSLAGNKIQAILGDAQGGLWIGSTQGLDYLPGPNKNPRRFRHDSAKANTLLDNRVYALLLDRQQRLWVGTAKGLQRLTANGRDFELFADSTMPKDITVLTLFQAQDGKIWLGSTRHGAAWLAPSPNSTPPVIHWLPLNTNPAPPSSSPTALNYPTVFGITQVNTGQSSQIWLASYGGGINIVAPEDGRILQHVRHDPALPSSLAMDTVKPLLLDRSGLLWIGTLGGGLQRFNSHNQMLRLLRHDRSAGLSNPDVHSALELANGQILFGTHGNGIDIFDRERGLVGGYRPAKISSVGVEVHSSQEAPNTLPDATVTALQPGRDGSIWAGTLRSGVVRMRPGSERWQPVLGVPGTHVRKILLARDGSLWLATERGVGRIGPAAQVDLAEQTTPAVSAYEPVPDEHGTPVQINVSALAEDAQGRIWAGTDNGLWLIGADAKRMQAIHPDPTRPDGLSSDFISSLLQDSRGQLWISTDKGLDRLLAWDGKIARFEHISTLIGQAGKAMGRNLIEDQAGRIWSEAGMIDLGTKSSKQAMRFTPLTKADGFDIGVNWINALAKTRSGLLLYGGTKGVAIIDPSLFKRWDYHPPLVATGLKIDGQSTPLGVLAQGPQVSSQQATRWLTIAPGQRNFSIEFAALDFSDPKNNRYQYRLQGYEKNWIDTGFEQRSAAFGNLSPGLYTLQVRGSNRLGDWSEHELAVTIQILPAWYQTWWFFILAWLSSASGIIGLIHMRTHYLHRRHIALERQVQQRTLDLQQKQLELVVANQDLHVSNSALNEANAELLLSVDSLRQLGDIGRDITANLDQIKVFQSLHTYLRGLLDTQSLAIYRMNPATQTLDLMFGQEDDQALPGRSIPIDSPTANVAQVARQRLELLRETSPDEPSLTHIPGTRYMRTALFSPLVVDERLLGVMSIQSERAAAYGQRERLIFRTLCAYGAIALANADTLAALQQAQTQLVQQEKLASLGSLVAGIAHEINTPLGTTLVAISGASKVWQRVRQATLSGQLSKSALEASTEEGIEYTELASSTAARTAELIRTFKTIALQTDSDLADEVDLAQLIPDIANLVHLPLEQANIDLKLDMPDGLPVRIVTDALVEALTRILLNVSDHAYAQGQSGSLWLCVTADAQQEVTITLTDQGQGIHPADLPRVFDPFFTTKRGIHGHIGLGLHVAYSHVTQRLKGKISIASTLGSGTTVTIQFKRR